MYANYGNHLDERIDNDKIWKTRWHDLAVMPLHRYDALGGGGVRFAALMLSCRGAVIPLERRLFHFLSYVDSVTCLECHMCASHMAAHNCFTIRLGGRKAIDYGIGYRAHLQTIPLCLLPQGIVG